MKRWKLSQRGFTLVELMLVLALVGILSVIGVWGAQTMMRGWPLRRATEQVLGDLKQVQGVAERSGDHTLVNGVPVLRRTFLVFRPTEQRYAMHLWHDLDRDGVPSVTETERVWERSLPPGVVFGWTPDVNRRACSNAPGLPGEFVTFTTLNAPPCNDQPCLRFDRQGFSTMGPGTIYLQHDGQAQAVSATRPGHFTQCRWNGERWQ